MMTRLPFKSVFVAIVCLMLAGCNGCSHKSSEEEPKPLSEVHSKAFTIEPIEGITISAAENALDKDREFKISPVSDEEWERATKKIADISLGQTPILCFDLDAGMKSDEVMPGCFQVAIDLNKLGIPKSLHDKLTVWRDDGGDDVYEYTSWVENGKLCFNSDQNCSIILGVIVGIPTYVVFNYIGESIQKHAYALHLYKGFFFQRDDLVIHEIKDKYGDFTLYFRFSDTEESSRFQSYKENAKSYYSEFNKVKKQADEIYQHRVDKEYKTELEDMGFWQKMVGSTAAYNRAKEAIDKAFILDSLSKADKYLQRYIKGMELPKSIQEVEHFLKISNEYYTVNQHLKPQTSKIDVYLVDAKSADGEACIVYPNLKKAYMVVNFDLPWADDPQRQHYQRKGRFENLLLTLNHELLHYRQKSTKSMDYRTEESMAAYNEKHAAYYFYNKHEMYANIFSKDRVTKAYIEKYYQWAPRSYYQAFGAPFNDKTDNDWAYTYADFMDFLQRKTRGETDFVSNAFLINDYRKSSTPKENYMRWFDIKDEKLFNDYLKEFCFDSINRIFNVQISEANTIPDRQQDLAFSKDKPIVEVKTGKGGLVTRTLFVTCNRKKKAPFNLFLLREKNVSADDLAFIGSWDNFARDANGAYIGTVQGDYFEGNTNTYKCGFFKVPNESLKITAVAYFQPDAPVINNVKDNTVTFGVPHPAKDLRDKELVSGIEYTYTDKSGHTETFIAGPDLFGKKVSWPIPGCSEPGNAFSLSCHWFYDRESGGICSSPESDKTDYGVMPKEEPKVDVAPAPVDEKIGYWLQVKSDIDTINTTLPTDPGDNSDATKYLRSIQVTREGDLELEFVGIATTEVINNEKATYEKAFYLNDYVNYTEPPKQWAPNTNYTCEWYTDKDPFLRQMDRPFAFTVENTSSAPSVCEQGSDKILSKNSNNGSMPWLHQVKTVFKTNIPQNDDPKAFTITQKYTVSGWSGSHEQISVVLTYDYIWVDGIPDDTPTEPVSDAHEELDFDIVYLIMILDYSQFFTEQDKANYQGVDGIGGVLYTQFAKDKGEISITSLGDKWFQVSAHNVINDFNSETPNSKNVSVNVVLKFHREAWGIDQISGNYSYTGKQLVPARDKGGTKYTVMNVQAGVKFGPGKMEGYQTACYPTTETMHASFSFEQKVGKEMVPRTIKVSENHQDCINIDMRILKKK